MKRYKVLSPLKSGGKVREIGEVIELEEAEAGLLREGILEPMDDKPTGKAGGKNAKK